MFEVSIEPYLSAQHDRIFKSGGITFLVAKIGTKRLINISVIRRVREKKF